jgi:hypothetical protein
MKRWTVKEEHKLIDLISEGLSHKQCADALGRTESAIHNRVQVMRERFVVVKPRSKQAEKVEQEESSSLALYLSILLNVALTAHIVFTYL